MCKSLQVRFLLLLFCVAFVALSGTLMLRGLMLRDFADYLDGDAQDRVYGILAAFEGAYERDAGWKAETQTWDVLWALTLGFESRLLDGEGRTVITTGRAVESASPALKRRLDALSRLTESRGADEFTPYPLFLGGRQIGTLDLSALRPVRGALFLRRAHRFLLLSIVIVGGLALLLSISFSGRLTRPIKELALAASAISRGDLSKRVAKTRSDEVGDLMDAFNKMARALETQETLRRKLIADVAHELRTPLGVMRGEIEAMVDGMIPIDESRLQSLYDETGRLKNMVEGIEELNSAEASVLSLKRQRVFLPAFLENIAERFRRISEEKGVSLELRCPDDAELFADPERLSQIVVNLLSNAMRATERGGTVSIAVASAPGCREIRVGDTGKGIREEDLPFIFERFYKGPEGGLGIGLTIVKELVEAHGGTVEAHSTPGEGSSFSLLFPITDVHNSS
jgi:two-component system sensor histidine kinase BaeS